MMGQQFNIYSWLQYSVERDAAFCLPCQHFSASAGKNEDVFTKLIMALVPCCWEKWDVTDMF